MGSPYMLSSGSSVASGSSGFLSVPTTSSSDHYTPSFDNLPPPTMTDQHSPMLTCMWGNCNASFYSLSDLVGHVNLQHLRLPNPVSRPSDHPSSIQQHLQNMSTDSLSCLWGDCNAYPSPNSIPGPSSSSETPFDAALTILASHLFQDHLGLPNDVSFAHRPANAPPVTVEATSDAAPDSSPTSPSEPQGSAMHECSGTHACHWKFCTQTFMSCDGLTAHITSAHVGAGKAHYECFWDGCKRNGGQGFASKQKICRHLQVRWYMFSSSSGHFEYANMGLVRGLESYRSSTISLQGVQAEFLRGCYTAAAHATAYARKSVACPFLLLG